MGGHGEHRTWHSVSRIVASDSSTELPGVTQNVFCLVSMSYHATL